MDPEVERRDSSAGSVGYSEGTSDVLQRTSVTPRENGTVEPAVQPVAKPKKRSKDTTQPHTDSLAQTQNEKLRLEIECNTLKQKVTQLEREAALREIDDDSAKQVKRELTTLQNEKQQLEQEHGSLEQEVERLQGTVNAMTKQLSNANKTVAELRPLQAEISDLRKDNSKLQIKVKTLETELQFANEAKQSHSTLEAATTQLRDRLAVVEDEKAGVADQLRKTSKQHKKENSALREELSKLQADLQVARAEADLARKEFQKLQAEKDKAQADILARHDEERRQLEADKSKVIEAEKVRNHEETDRLRVDLNEARKEAKDLQTEYHSKLREHDEAKAQLDVEKMKLQHQIDHLQATVETLNADFAKEVERHKESLAQQQQETANNRDRLSKELDEQQRANDQLKNDLNLLHTEKMELQTKLQQAELVRDKLAALENVNEEVNSKLQAAQEELTRQSEKEVTAKETTAKDKEVLKEQITTTETEKVRLESEIRSLERDLSSSKDKILGLEMELKRNVVMATQISELQQHNKQIDIKRVELESELKHSESVVQRLQAQVSSYESNMKDKEFELKNKIMNNSEQQTQLVLKETEILNLKNELNDLSSQSDNYVVKCKQEIQHLHASYQEEIERLKQGYDAHIADIARTNQALEAEREAVAHQIRGALTQMSEPPSSATSVAASTLSAGFLSFGAPRLNLPSHIIPDPPRRSTFHPPKVGEILTPALLAHNTLNRSMGTTSIGGLHTSGFFTHSRPVPLSASPMDCSPIPDSPSSLPTTVTQEIPPSYTQGTRTEVHSAPPLNHSNDFLNNSKSGSGNLASTTATRTKRVSGKAPTDLFKLAADIVEAAGNSVNLHSPPCNGGGKSITPPKNRNLPPLSN